MLKETYASIKAVFYLSRLKVSIKSIQELLEKR
jgi:hypothetical protein